MSATKVTDALCGVLADTYVLQVKTQNYHWNVVGPYFPALHILFENQYNELFAAVDEIAERIRQIGESAPGTMAEFLRLTVVSEAEASSAAGMVADLAACNSKLCGRLGALVEIAEKAEDDSTQDLAIRRLNAHQKAEWMLRATLGEEAATPPQKEEIRAEEAAKPAKETKTAKKVKSKPVSAPAPKPVVVKAVKTESKKPSKKKSRVAFG